MRKYRKKIGFIGQVAILFAVGLLFTGLFAFFSQQVRYDSKIKSETEVRSSQIAKEVRGSLEEYPAHQWLLEYWYENADDMDIEYDVDFSNGVKTEKKAVELTEKYPDLQLKYATEEEIGTMDPADQKKYAEVTYSWLITRVNQIKSAYDINFLFCVIPYDSFRKQFFLFSGSDPGDKRGTSYEETYPIGHRVEIIDESQRKSMIAAQKNQAHIASAGQYVDYYSLMGNIGERPVLIGITYDVSDLTSEINTQTIRATLAVSLYQILLAAFCMLLLYRFVLHPLKKVMDNIRAYKNSKDSEEAIKNLSAIPSQNEIGQLAGDTSELIKEMDDYTKKIRSVTAENERISTELNLATRIQKSMLPSIFPAFPERNEFDLYASMDPAREVGGDFYDFFMIDEDHLCMVIADVSGKGVPAALFMMASKIMLANNAKMGKTPAQILKDTNDSVCANNKEEMFVTVWIGILEISTGKLTAANAGHEYPVVKHKDDDFDIIKDKHGFVIGGIDGIDYEEYEVRLEPGEKLFIYTDGVPEATNGDNDMYGVERLIEALNKNKDADPQEILSEVRSSVDEFVDGVEQFDDLTMLCMEYRGGDAGDE